MVNSTIESAQKAAKESLFLKENAKSFLNSKGTTEEKALIWKV